VKVSNLLLVSLLIGVMVGLVIIYTLPSTTSYSVVNYGDNGISRLKESYKALVITDLSASRDISPRDAVYLIIRLDSVTLSEAETVLRLVNEGGYVIFSGSWGAIESLSHYVKLNLTVTSSVIYDMIYNGGDRFHPLGFSNHCNCTLTTYTPYYVVTGENTDVVAYSSNFSYVDLNGNGYMDIDEPLGSFPLGVSLSYGGGRLILVFSPQVFTNELFEANKDFIDCLVGGRGLVIDQSEIKGDFIEYLRLVTITHEVTYPALIFLVSLLCVVAYYVLKER